MIKIRPSLERGQADYGWLQAKYSFSFARYIDRDHVGFRVLRVINEDQVAPGRGFDTHPHQNMEILTYIISGQLEHQDSMGNGRIIETGELQAMSAGSGVTHSESNPSKTSPVHLLQIWITPDKQDITPSYSEWKPPAKLPAGELILLASATGQNGSVIINQDVNLYLSKLKAEQEVTYDIDNARHVWLQIIEGKLILNGEIELNAGDGVAISEEKALIIAGLQDSKFLLFDLP